VVKQGICQVPEGRLVFANLSVYDNLMMGAYLRSDKTSIIADLQRVYALFPRLSERQGQMAGTLSGGEQQMLTMGRGLMSSPRIMLLDEPSLGLAPLLVETIYQVIAEIRRAGTTILLVEQNAYKALAVADRAYVLEHGIVTQEGPARELLHDPRIRQAYLGVKQGQTRVG
jgi:branched-chain amino acid transport system ATP-binding protein